MALLDPVEISYSPINTVGTEARHKILFSPFLFCRRVLLGCSHGKENDPKRGRSQVMNFIFFYFFMLQKQTCYIRSHLLELDSLILLIRPSTPT